MIFLTLAIQTNIVLKLRVHKTNRDGISLSKELCPSQVHEAESHIFRPVVLIHSTRDLKQQYTFKSN